MRLVDLIPDVDVLCALEPNELGLTMLPALAAFQPATRFPYQSSKLGLNSFLGATLGSGQQPQSQYPAGRRDEVMLAITEAWCWLEGTALLVSDPSYYSDAPVRLLTAARPESQIRSAP